jgi:hypothetical protein
VESTAEIIHEIRPPEQAPSLLYANADDPRLVVPGPMPVVGLTPNLGNRIFWLVSFGLALALLLWRRR